MSEFKSNYDAQVEDFTDELSDEALDRSESITALYCCCNSYYWSAGGNDR